MINKNFNPSISFVLYAFLILGLIIAIPVILSALDFFSFEVAGISTFILSAFAIIGFVAFYNILK